MSHPIALIAAREFRTYVATTSFWIALALGPVLMGGALLLAASVPKAPPSASLTLVAKAGAVEAQFSDDFPLSQAARREVLGLIASDGRVSGPIVLPPPAEPEIDATSLTRFGMVLMLWLALVGSLGMLLQTVVRERVNRALECLLAAARPVDIVLGKLAGVGAVSALVLGAWLGSAAGLGALAPEAGGAASAILGAFADPRVLARAGLLYILGYAFYGLSTVAIGALARDDADAQNLARPMFAVLLAVFFTAMAMMGGGGPAWLVFVPPFTPFALLMSPQAPAVEIAALAGLAATTIVAGVCASRLLRVDRPTLRLPLKRWARA